VSSDTSRNPAQGVSAAKGASGVALKKLTNEDSIDGGSKPGTTLSGVAIFMPKRQMKRDMTIDQRTVWQINKNSRY